ncbi:hypothetical protein [Luteimonas salinilitoris]|uniref:hypothetical protein n=1 Tax=Luteimonas salinilitoris TaxID=3237697 RepID=UPI00351C0396
MLGIVLSVLALTTNTSRAAESTAPGNIDSRLVARVPLEPESRPQWARFSPENPRHILVGIDNRGVLVSLPEGTTRHIAGELSPVGWLGQTVVARDQSGRFRLLDTNDLIPTTRVAAGSLSLPWTFGKDHRIRFDVALPGAAISTIPLRIPGAGTDERALIAYEDRGPAVVAPDDNASTVVDAAGGVLFRGDKKIYGVSLSPDAYKLLVYYGNTEHVLFNRLTKHTTRLPPIIHAWTWLPDSSTLIGEISLSGEPAHEEVDSTDLYIYDLAGAKLDQVGLPSFVRGAALKILDVSVEGHILVEAERVTPEPAYLGLMVLELLWQ